MVDPLPDGRIPVFPAIGISVWTPYSVRMSRSDVRRWEYRSLRPPREETMKEASDPTAQLNSLGAEGWELATTIDYAGGGTKYLVMKRPKDATSNDE